MAIADCDPDIGRRFDLVLVVKQGNGASDSGQGSLLYTVHQRKPRPSVTDVLNRLRCQCALPLFVHILVEPGA